MNLKEEIENALLDENTARLKTDSIETFKKVMEIIDIYERFHNPDNIN